jgi:hypothetical protein
MDWTEGLTAIEIRCAATTVRVAVSLKEPIVAVIVVCPAAIVVARPEALIVARDFDDDVQVTPEVKSALLPSL